MPYNMLHDGIGCVTYRSAITKGCVLRQLTGLNFDTEINRAKFNTSRLGYSEPIKPER
jgi:hypothetical protein